MIWLDDKADEILWLDVGEMWQLCGDNLLWCREGVIPYSIVYTPHVHTHLQRLAGNRPSYLEFLALAVYVMAARGHINLLQVLHVLSACLRLDKKE